MGQGGPLFHKGVTTRDPRVPRVPSVPRNLPFHFLGEHVFPRGHLGTGWASGTGGASEKLNYFHGYENP